MATTDDEGGPLVSFQPKGPITTRLRSMFASDDPIWWPGREAKPYVDPAKVRRADKIPMGDRRRVSRENNDD